MGQRLNIEIVANGEPLVNAYYHWSAFTGSSLGLLKTILTKVKKVKRLPIEKRDRVLRVIRILESTGAGLKARDVLYAIQTLKLSSDPGFFKECEDRNQGLLAISYHGMEDNRYWAEHSIKVDIAKRIVDFDVMYEHSEEDRDYDDCEEPSEEEGNILKLDCNLKEMSYEQTFSFIKEYSIKQQRPYYKIRYLQDSQGLHHVVE